MRSPDTAAITTRQPPTKNVAWYAESTPSAPVADFDLLAAAHAAATSAALDVQVRVGLVQSSDSFYSPRPDITMKMVEFGVLAVEMEASALYTIAAGFSRRALAICTVSDHVVTGVETTAAERETSFREMVEIALAAGTSVS